jgi:hypothetical protein
VGWCQGVYSREKSVSARYDVRRRAAYAERSRRGRYPRFIIIDGERIIRRRRMRSGPEIESWLESELEKSLKNSE